MKIEHQSIMAEMNISYKTKHQMQSKKIDGGPAASDYLKSLWNDDLIEYQEEFICLFLNRANNIIGWIKVSSGGTAGTLVDPKIVFSSALLSGASSIILSHNHPSGNLNTSEADRQITNKLVAAGKLLDIKVLDHIIITKESYYSFADNGLM